MPPTFSSSGRQSGKRNKTRYYSEDDPEFGVTRAQFKRLSRARKLQYMTHWFHSNYEDPAQETPYESAEGGYIYINGGPYEAGDEIGSEFADIASDKLIEEAVDLVQEDGIIDWAPKRDSEHFEDVDEDFEPPPIEPGAFEESQLEEILRRLEAGLTPEYGDPHEQQQRQKLVEKIDDLKRALADNIAARPGIGHNNPPADGGDAPPVEPTENEVAAEVVAAATEIRSELVTPEPDAKNVARAAIRLRKCIGWIGGKLDAFADSYVKALGTAAAVATLPAVAAISIPGVRQSAFDIVVQAAQWLSHVTTIGLPF